MRGKEIKECMTGWADGGYCALGAMQLRLQITYARERRVGWRGGVVEGLEAL